MLPSTSNIVQCMLRATNKIKCTVFIITFLLRAKGRLLRQQSISYLFITNSFATVAVPHVHKSVAFCMTEDLPSIIPPITCFQVNIGQYFGLNPF